VDLAAAIDIWAENQEIEPEARKEGVTKESIATVMKAMFGLEVP
jgi:hypothetical protein